MVAEVIEDIDTFKFNKLYKIKMLGVTPSIFYLMTNSSNTLITFCLSTSPWLP